MVSCSNTGFFAICGAGVGCMTCRNVDKEVSVEELPARVAISIVRMAARVGIGGNSITGCAAVCAPESTGCGTGLTSFAAFAANSGHNPNVPASEASPISNLVSNRLLFFCFIGSVCIENLHYLKIVFIDVSRGNLIDFPLSAFMTFAASVGS
jgi:hypothetical protein